MTNEETLSGLLGLNKKLYRPMGLPENTKKVGRE